MSGLPTEIQRDGRQLNENGEIAGEFPNGTIDSNRQVLLGKRREPGGSSTVQRRRQSTASKARDSKSEESIIAAFCTWIVDHQIGKLQARIDSDTCLRCGRHCYEPSLVAWARPCLFSSRPPTHLEVLRSFLLQPKIRALLHRLG
jgi:hypothetical protein